MNYKTKDAILREAEKLTDEFIQITWRKDDAGEYALCAVAFMDGYGMPIDYLTEFAPPAEVLAGLQERNADNGRAAAMFPDKATATSYELAAANMD